MKATLNPTLFWQVHQYHLSKTRDGKMYHASILLTETGGMSVFGDFIFAHEWKAYGEDFRRFFAYSPISMLQEQLTKRPGYVHIGRTFELIRQLAEYKFHNGTLSINDLQTIQEDIKPLLSEKTWTYEAFERVIDSLQSDSWQTFYEGQHFFDLQIEVQGVHEPIETFCDLFLEELIDIVRSQLAMFEKAPIFEAAYSN